MDKIAQVLEEAPLPPLPPMVPPVASVPAVRDLRQMGPLKRISSIVEKGGRVWTFTYTSGAIRTTRDTKQAELWSREWIPNWPPRRNVM